MLMKGIGSQVIVQGAVLPVGTGDLHSIVNDILSRLTVYAPTPAFWIVCATSPLDDGDGRPSSAGRRPAPDSIH